jgi:hypothetical protein
VPTIEEIIRAPDLQFETFRSYINGIPQLPHGDSRVIRYVNPSKERLTPTRIVFVELHRIAILIIDELDPTDALVPILRKAAHELLSETGKIHHETSNFDKSLMLYIMRPTLAKGNQLKAFMDHDLPPDLDSARSFGFPVRGSDKCNQESIRDREREGHAQ